MVLNQKLTLKSLESLSTEEWRSNNIQTTLTQKLKTDWTSSAPTPTLLTDTPSTTTIYKQFIRPILTCAHTAWQPDTAKTHINKPQTTQNTALWITTGCTKSTPLPHLHEENPSPPSHLPYGHERHTHLHFYSISTAPLHFMQNPTQTRRKIHLAPAQHYHMLHNTLPSFLDNSCEDPHPHRVFLKSTGLPPSLVSCSPLPARQSSRWTAGSGCNWGDSGAATPH